jgi:hypothetical protein
VNEQLQALFTQHRNVILGVGAAGVAGLALLNKRKKASGAPSGSTSPAGTIPAAAVVPASGVQGAYPNTTETNIRNSIMDDLLKQQAAMTSAGGGAAAAPKPIASSLFAPSGSGNYVLYGDGTVAEVQTDGSQLGLSYQQWTPLAQKGVTPVAANQQHPGGAYYETTGNLNAVPKPA